MDKFNILYNVLILITCMSLFTMVYFYRKKKIAVAKHKYTSYAQDNSWQKLQQHLPSHLHISTHNQPKESFWKWREHNIHIDYYPRPQASAKLVLVHGAGTHGRHMSLILGQPLAKLGYEVFALDLPGYGLSKVINRSKIDYQQWIDLLDEFVRKEACKDQRPIFLCGVSSGGMLALHVAMVNPFVRGVIGLAFLDLKQIDVQKSTIRFSPFSSLSLRGLDFAVQTPLQEIHLPMSLVSKMYSLTNNRAALKILMADPLSAGNAMSVHFLNSYVNYQPPSSFKDFTQCPVLLTQPAADTISPLSLSKAVLDKLNVDYQVVMLPKGSHYPLEKEALDTLITSTMHFVETYK